MAVQRKYVELASRLVRFQDDFGVMSDEDCQSAIDKPRDFIAVATEAWKAHPKRVLMPSNNRVVYEEVGQFDPNAFYRTCEELSISIFFRDNLLPFAKKVDNLPASTGKSFDLLVSAREGDITPRLPEGYIFNDFSECLARIAKVIEKQLKGKGSGLLCNCSTNIFFTADFEVHVCWINDHGHWCVSGMARGNDVYLDTLTRVFSNK